MTAQAMPSLGFAIYKPAYGSTDIFPICGETEKSYTGAPTVRGWRQKAYTPRIPKDTVYSVVATEEEARAAIKASREAVRPYDDKIMVLRQQIAAITCERNEVKMRILSGSSAEGAVNQRES